VVPVFAIWWLSQGRPVFKDRYLIASLAPFQVLLAAALVPVSSGNCTHLQWRRALRILQFTIGIVLACVLGAGVLSGLRNYMAQELAARKMYAGMYETFVKFSGGFPPDRVRWAVTYPDYAFTCYLRTSDYLVMPYRANDQGAADSVVRELRDSGVRRVLLQIVNDSYWNGPAIAVPALSKEFTQIDEAFTGEWPVKIYSRINPGALRDVGVTFTNGITLDAARIRPDFQSRLLEVHFKWSGNTQALTDGLKLFIHVSRENTPNQLVTQLDVPFTADDLSGRVRTFGVPLPQAMPNSPYQVYVGLYNSSQAGMPRVLTRLGADQVDIARFAIPESNQRRR
jgi:hypothetical protein